MTDTTFETALYEHGNDRDRDRTLVAAIEAEGGVVVGNDVLEKWG